MMMALAAAAALLYGPRTPEEERKRSLLPLFKPLPNSQLELDRLSFLENRGDPSRMQGSIWIDPPKGQCLIIRGDLKKRDRRICKKSPYTWRIDDLDALGRLNFLVLIEAEWDDGVLLKWDSDYRIGNFTAAGDKGSGIYDDIVIQSCKASTIDGERSIVLESFEGRRWRLTLPEFDTPVRSFEEPIPNLLVNIDSNKNKADSQKEPAGDKKEEHGERKDNNDDKKDEKKPTGGGGSILGALLSKGYEAELVQDVKYILPARGAFTMESGLFSETGSPKGMGGQCRYMFRGAPGDPRSGAIECHDTDTSDHLYLHVTCFSELEPRFDPKAKKPKIEIKAAEKLRTKEGTGH